MPLFGGPPDVASLRGKKDVPGLIKALGYRKDAAIRKKAAEALALDAFRDPRAVQPLIRALGDEDVRWYAVRALGSIGDPRAVEPLIATLTDPHELVGSAAAEALGRIGDPRAIEPLVVALRNNDIRQDDVAGALSRLGWSPEEDEAGGVYWAALRKWDKCVAIGAPAVEALVTVLTEPDYNTHLPVVKALGEIGDRRAVEPLIAVLSRRDRGLPEAAAKALGQIGDRRAVEPLIASLNDGNNWGAPDAVAKALGQIGDHRAVEPLVAALLDWRVPKDAAWALNKLAWRPDRGAAGAAYWAARGNWDRCVSIGVPAVDPLIKALNDGGAVRAAAAAAIVRIGTPAVERLTAALRERQQQAVVEVLDKLAWSPDRGATGAAYWAAKGDWDRCASIGVPAVDPLVGAFRYGPTDERCAVATWLGHIGTVQAIEPLIVALSDESLTVRKAAAAGLVNIYRSGTMDASQQAQILAQQSVITATHHDHTDSTTVGSHETHFDGHGDSGIGVDFPV